MPPQPEPSGRCYRGFDIAGSDVGIEGLMLTEVKTISLWNRSEKATICGSAREKRSRWMVLSLKGPAAWINPSGEPIPVKHVQQS